MFLILFRQIPKLQSSRQVIFHRLSSAVLNYAEASGILSKHQKSGQIPLTVPMRLDLYMQPTIQLDSNLFFLRLFNFNLSKQTFSLPLIIHSH